MEEIRRVIIIAATADDAEAIGGILAASGFEVQATCSAPQGLSLAATAPPFAIICDSELSSLSGALVARMLKNNGATAAVPLLMITSGDDAIDNADMCLPRGFQAADLLNGIEWCAASARAYSGQAAAALAIGEEAPQPGEAA